MELSCDWREVLFQSSYLIMRNWMCSRALRSKNLKNRLITWLGVIVVIIIISSISINNVRKSLDTLWTTDPPQTKYDENTKTILLWNDFFTMKHFGVPLGRMTFADCKVKNCQLWDRLDSEPDLPYHKYDALVFHGIDTGRSSMDDLPLRRSPEQRYIFVLLESPIKWPNFYNLKNFFNWTATYRRDSDIYNSYVEIRSKDGLRNPRDNAEIWQEPTFQNTDIPEEFSNKSKQVLWFVSNRVTQSGRELYANELAKYIQVNIYGRGRRLTCTRADINCDTMLNTTYKFYLAFENSLCEDYVTEKLLRALKNYIVPIVYGGADYKLYAPPLSYINVQDFVSPRALARYLHYLDQNPKEYQKYFWWKQFYHVDGGNVWCEICEKLHEPDTPNKVYPDMGLWWNYPGVCSTPKENFSKNRHLPITA